MRFTCTTKDLLAATAPAARIVNGSTTVPILKNVVISANADGSVRVKATDLETTIERTLNAIVAEPGEATTDAKTFTQYLSNLSGTEITVEGFANKVDIKCGRSSCSFPGLPAGDYPPTPAAAAQASIDLDAAAFRQAAEGVTFAASTEEARGQVLMGTLLEVEADKITMVATDGYRLAIRSVAAKGGESKTLIVPSHGLAEIARNFGDGDIVVNTLGAGNHVSATNDGTAIAVRLVDGSYPNYKQVLPKGEFSTVTVDTDDFIAALKRAQLVAGDRASMIKMTVSTDVIAISAQSDISGSAQEEVEASYSGAETTIAFNARYLIEILNHVRAEKTLIELRGPLAPAKIRSGDADASEEAFYVLMPLRQ